MRQGAQTILLQMQLAHDPEARERVGVELPDPIFIQNNFLEACA